MSTYATFMAVAREQDSKKTIDRHVFTRWTVCIPRFRVTKVITANEINLVYVL